MGYPHECPSDLLVFSSIVFVVLTFRVAPQQLPYGTMTDDEMKAMPIPQLQDEGLLFLWVTGRAMELGRECMQAWG